MPHRRLMTRHHLRNKSRGGKTKDSNLLTLEWYRHHEPWHALFGNMSLLEAIEVLKRIAELKCVPPEPRIKIILIPLKESQNGRRNNG